MGDHVAFLLVFQTVLSCRGNTLGPVSIGMGEPAKQINSAWLSE